MIKGSVMRKTLFLLIPLLIAAGCTKELTEVPGIEEAISVFDEIEAPEVTVIKASFENPETRTHLEMNEAQTFAKVLWTKGDEIRLIGMLSDGSRYYRTFSTQDENVTNANFACTGWNPDTTIIRYYAYYPEESYQGAGIDKLGVYIPSVQTAVAGGIAEGLNIAYATAERMSDGLVFKNIPSLLKFRLSGSGVEDLSCIKFVANATIAGECLIQDLEEQDPTFSYNSYYRPLEEATGNVVKLNGPFQAGTDYYIAVFPGTTEGFTMIFMNSSGDYSIKSSSKTLTMGRSQITDFGTITVDSSFSDPLVTRYMTKTSTAKPVDIVVIPDGYTAEQKELFETRASACIDFLFDTAPYSKYKKYFNVYFIWAPSEQEGASVTDGKGTITTLRNTAFGSRWGENSYNDMTADSDRVYGYVSAHCPEIVKEILAINEVPILLLINDTRYGGIAHSSGSGKTYCQVPYTYEGEGISWSFPKNVAVSDADPTQGTRKTTNDEYAELGRNSGDWRNTVLHEFGGHSFGRLKDEYWYTDYYTSESDLSAHGWTVPFGLNVSGHYNVVPWQDLLDRKSALAASNPLYGRIGKFQGADVSILYRWRSEKISCMIDNRQYFSTWQRILIAKRITELAGETFDLDYYLQTLDVIYDPVRDENPSHIKAVNSSGPIIEMPLLPPPELIDDTPIPIED